MTKIKLTKVEDAPYKCSATYEWNGHIIERDDSHFAGERCYWFCDTLFEGKMFRTLKGLRHAIQLYADGELNDMELGFCEEE